jgi:hypothetical protein
VTLVVDGAVLAGYTVPERDRPRVTIAAGGRTVTAELNPKSLRKAIATIREHGAEAVAVVLQAISVRAMCSTRPGSRPR